MLVINSGNVVVDEIWLWRADHWSGGNVYNGDNPCHVGLVVNGDNVTIYSLAVEHALTDLVQWNGEGGRVYFYQSELPYDVNSTYGTSGYVSYRVSPSVTSHNGYGIGVYSFFRDNSVFVENGISTGSSSNIQFVSPFTVFLNGNGAINHVINEVGNSVQAGSNPSYVCTYP